ncbi:hypothetical protein AB6F20_08580 [Providencia hangzhouensis]
MKQRELINKYSNTLSVTCFVTACIVPTFYAWGEEDTTYEFNSGFIIGSKEDVDLTRFNSSGLVPENIQLTYIQITIGRDATTLILKKRKVVN